MSAHKAPTAVDEREEGLVGVTGEVRYQVEWRGTLEWFPAVWHHDHEVGRSYLDWYRANHPGFAWRLVRIETGTVTTRVL